MSKTTDTWPALGPIMFQAATMAAIAAGRKSQTRRIVKRLRGFGQVTEFGPSDTPGYHWAFRDKHQRWNELTNAETREQCLYGQPGDELWTREAYWKRAEDGLTAYDDGSIRLPPTALLGPRWYAAHEGDRWTAEMATTAGFKRVAAQYMPEWASRYRLTITDIRLQPVQAITDADARAEGVQDRAAFTELWDAINGDGSWDANPYVWAIEFTTRMTDGRPQDKQPKQAGTTT